MLLSAMQIPTGQSWIKAWLEMNCVSLCFVCVCVYAHTRNSSMCICVCVGMRVCFCSLCVCVCKTVCKCEYLYGPGFQRLVMRQMSLGTSGMFFTLYFMELMCNYKPCTVLTSLGPLLSLAKSHTGTSNASNWRLTATDRSSALNIETSLYVQTSL